MEVITASERCPEGVPHAHWHWFGVCGVEDREEGRENNIFGKLCFLGTDFV